MIYAMTNRTTIFPSDRRTLLKEASRHIADAAGVNVNVNIVKRGFQKCPYLSGRK